MFEVDRHAIEKKQEWRNRGKKHLTQLNDKNLQFGVRIKEATIRGKILLDDMTTFSDLVALLDPKDILETWPDVVPLKLILGVPTLRSLDSLSEQVFEGHDEEQIRLMDELCIVLDNEDTPIGAGTKKLCHMMENINAGLLHRAFSVFSFNKSGKLLLQQRADEKITFPGMWTNTCCSHPLCVPSELGSDSASGSQNILANAIKGATVAAQRKLLQELGIPYADSPLEDFTFLTRIHYKSASSVGTVDLEGHVDSAAANVWGEHEIDYIFILQTNDDIEINANPNEVKATRYVDAQELKEMLQDPSLVFTPWFKLICETSLFKWWDNLSNLSAFYDDKIHRLL